jgi:hypothetical protein
MHHYLPLVRDRCGSRGVFIHAFDEVKSRGGGHDLSCLRRITSFSMSG